MSRKSQRTPNDTEILFRIIATIVIAVGLFFLDKCSCDTDYDDRWDRIDHTIKTDPYFKQW